MGFRRKPERALLAIAINRIIPPSKVYLPAVSPRKSHTQNGPKTTSVIESSANSAEGTAFEPKVYRISPAPTWKTPKAKAIQMSRFGTSSPYPLIWHNAPAIIIAKRPARKTVGNMSSNFFQRREIVKTAKPSADINAATLPIIRPIEIPSQTMMTIPTNAAIMDIHVAFRTCSLSTNQPRIAAKKGAEANKNIAFATDVVCKARMPPEKAKTNEIPPTTPAKPTLWIIGKGLPRARKVKTKSNKGVSARERKNRICHTLATSM